MIKLNTGRKKLSDEEVKRVENIQGQIKQNSADWHSTDDEEKKAGLHRGNEMLYSSLDEITGGKSTFDEKSGTWSTEFSPVEDNKYENYTPVNQDEINSLISDLSNSKFSYSAETDPLYDIYRDAYIKEGDRASKSTLADIATAQGGVSSYAASAAQQANNYYAGKIADKIPELEALAYQKYSADINNKHKLLNAYQTQDNTAYNRWYNDKMYDYQLGRDAVLDSQWEKNYNLNKEGQDFSNAIALKNYLLNERAQDFNEDYTTKQFDEDNKRYYLEHPEYSQNGVTQGTTPASTGQTVKETKKPIVAEEENIEPNLDAYLTTVQTKEETEKEEAIEKIEKMYEDGTLTEQEANQRILAIMR